MLSFRLRSNEISSFRPSGFLKSTFAPVPELLQATAVPSARDQVRVVALLPVRVEVMTTRPPPEDFVRVRFTLDEMETMADLPSDDAAQVLVTVLSSSSLSESDKPSIDELVPWSAAAATTSPWDAFTIPLVN